MKYIVSRTGADKFRYSLLTIAQDGQYTNYFRISFSCYVPVPLEDHFMDVPSLAFIPLASTVGHFRERLQGDVGPDRL